MAVVNSCQIFTFLGFTLLFFSADVKSISLKIRYRMSFTAFDTIHVFYFAQNVCTLLT